MPLGCLTNCLPAFVPFLLALVVAAYSWGDRALIAASGDNALQSCYWVYHSWFSTFVLTMI
tara:strand:+ start:1686 stop:1868 length:183 start_codon:yes stop_codon:yes gene_type:complete